MIHSPSTELMRGVLEVAGATFLGITFLLIALIVGLAVRDWRRERKLAHAQAIADAEAAALPVDFGESVGRWTWQATSGLPCQPCQLCRTPTYGIVTRKRHDFAQLKLGPLCFNCLPRAERSTEDLRG